MNLGFCMSTSHWGLDISEPVWRNHMTAQWAMLFICFGKVDLQPRSNHRRRRGDYEYCIVSTTQMCLSVQLLHVWVLWRKRKLYMKHDQILPQSSVKYFEYSRILLPCWIWSLEREISNRGLAQSRDYPSAAAIRNRHKCLEEQHGPFPGLFCPDYAYL